MSFYEVYSSPGCIQVPRRIFAYHCPEMLLSLRELLRLQVLIETAGRLTMWVLMMVVMVMLSRFALLTIPTGPAQLATNVRLRMNPPKSIFSVQREYDY